MCLSTPTGNAITGDGANHFVEAMQFQNTVLKVLDLRGKWAPCLIAATAAAACHPAYSMQADWALSAGSRPYSVNDAHRLLLHPAHPKSFVASSLSARAAILAAAPCNSAAWMTWHACGVAGNPCATGAPHIMQEIEKLLQRNRVIKRWAADNSKSPALSSKSNSAGSHASLAPASAAGNIPVEPTDD
jgi:hypothetical protein